MTAASIQQLDEFLKRVHREVLPLGVREYERAYQVLASQHWPDLESLRPALVALLAGNKDQSGRIKACFDSCFFDAESHLKIHPSAASPGAAQLQDRLRRRSIHRRRWITFLLGLFGLSVTFFRSELYRKHKPDPEVKPPQLDTVAIPPDPPPNPDVEPIIQFAEKEPANSLLVQVPALPERNPLGWLIVGMLAFVLCTIGLRLLLLPGSLRRLRTINRQKRTEELIYAVLSTGDLMRPSYRVQSVLPVPRTVIEDCSTLLGRLARQEHSDDLDVPKTVQATIAEAGRVVPIFTQRRTANDLLVLIDYEDGDHPWLGMFLSILDRWQRQGIHISRYRFRAPFPQSLDPLPSGDSLFLHDLARSQGDAALVIFSRKLSVRILRQAANWTTELGAWPLRAWLDPDPRPLSERTRAERADIQRLIQSGLTRFPMSAQGMLALCRFFAEDGVGVTPPTWEPLPVLKTRAVRDAVELWACAASLVPDASWDQLQALRIVLPELAQALPDARCLQRLIEWVKEHSGQDPELGVRVLDLSPAFQDHLLKVLRHRDPAGSFERRVHLALLGQLGETPPREMNASSLARLLWELKRAQHLALLAPRYAMDYLRPFFGSAVENLLHPWLTRELKQQEELYLFSVRDRAEIAGLLRGHAGVDGKDLIGARPLTWIWAIAGSLLVVLLWGGIGWLGPIVGQKAGITWILHRRPLVAEFPSTKQAERVNLPRVESTDAAKAKHIWIANDNARAAYIRMDFQLTIKILKEARSAEKLQNPKLDLEVTSIQSMAKLFEQMPNSTFEQMSSHRPTDFKILIQKYNQLNALDASISGGLLNPYITNKIHTYQDSARKIMSDDAARSYQTKLSQADEWLTAARAAQELNPQRAQELCQAVIKLLGNTGANEKIRSARELIDKIKLRHDQINAVVSNAERDERADLMMKQSRGLIKKDPSQARLLCRKVMMLYGNSAKHPKVQEAFKLLNSIKSKGDDDDEF